MAELLDACGRRIDYLCLSVTDRCDLRCTYCMPPEFDDYEPPSHWLDFDELERVARIFIALGVTHIRLTGDYIWRQNKQVEQGKFRPLRMLGEA